MLRKVVTIIADNAAEIELLRPKAEEMVTAMKTELRTNPSDKISMEKACQWITERSEQIRLGEVCLGSFDEFNYDLPEESPHNVHGHFKHWYIQTPGSHHSHLANKITTRIIQVLEALFPSIQKSQSGDGIMGFVN